MFNLQGCAEKFISAIDDFITQLPNGVQSLQHG